MGKKIWPVFILHLLLSFYPLTYIASANVDSLGDFFNRESLLISVVFLTLGLVNFLIYLPAKRFRYTLIFYFSYLFLFAWRPFTELTGGEWMSRFALFVFIYAVLAILLFKLSKKEKVQKILFVTFFIVGLLPLVQISTSLLFFHPTPKNTSPIVSTWAKEDSVKKEDELQNIYIIIFDSMTSTEHFLRHFSADSALQAKVQETRHTLGQFGFQELPQMRSNYPRTSYSMISFFSATYFTDDLPTADGGFTQGSLLKEMNQKGLKQVMYEQTAGKCDPHYLHCFKFPHHHELTSFLFTNTPLRYVVHKLDKYVFRPLNSALMKKIFVSLGSKKIEQLDALETYLQESSAHGVPRVSYIHLEGMHGPNFFNPQCKVVDLKLYDPNLNGRVNVDVAFNEASYRAEYPCFLDRMMRLGKIFQDKDPNAWVFFLADHGYGIEKFGHEYEGQWGAWELAQAFDVTAWIKVPKTCETYFAGAKSLVNLSRALVNCVNGRKKLSPLPDQHYFLDAKSKKLKRVDPGL